MLAHFNETHIVVYQAFHERIAREAVERGRFGDPFRLTRMSWIKPSFLWMMYRSGWATKPDQERVLAIWLQRAHFDRVLALATPTAHHAEAHKMVTEWKQAVETTEVLVQWDPDRDLVGNPLARRAIQLGLRGEVLRSYALHWPAQIHDITDMVHRQRAAIAEGRWQDVLVPTQQVYPWKPGSDSYQ